MNKKLANYLVGFVFVSLVYLFVNIEVLIWRFLDPDGFWGFVWFYVVSAIALFIFFLIIDFILTATMLRRKDKMGIWSIIVIGLFFILSGVVYLSPTIFITRALKDRYKYIERSEKYFSEGKFTEALEYSEKLYNRAIDRKPSSFILLLPYLFDKSQFGIDRNNIQIYQASINYAMCLQASGVNIKKAEDCFLNCKALAINHFPNQPEFLIIPILGLSKIYMANGDNRNAENCYSDLSKLLNKLDKNDIYNAVQTYLYYAMYYTNNGDFERAAKFREQAFVIYNNSPKNKESLNYLALLLPVANDYLNTDISAAEGLLKKAEQIAKNHKDDLLYVQYLITNAHVLELKGELKESEEVLLEVVDQIKERQGEQHSQYARSLGSLASFYYRYGQINRAALYFNKALIVLQKYPKFQDYYSILLGSAVADYSTHKNQSAITKIGIIENYLFNQINESFGLLTEEEREIYISYIEKQFTLINKIYVLLNDPVLNGHLYNNILAIKSIALQSNQYLKDYIQNSNQIDLINNFKYLLSKKEQLTRLKISGTVNDGLISRIQDSINVLEKQFLARLVKSTKFESFKVNSITWKDICKSLNENEAAIEYINVPQSLSNTSNKEYFALVLKPNSTTPILVPLFQEQTITKILTQKGTTKERISAIYGNGSVQILNNYIWQPVKQHLTGSKKVFISISGILNQVSFPALTIDEKLDIIFLSSTRKIVHSNSNQLETKKRLATLYGGIDYNGITKSNLNSQIPKLNISTTSFFQNVLRSGIQPLPNTKIEVNEIASILSKKSFDTILYTGIHATKSSFENLVFNQPKILHIATHGFYYPREQSYRINELLFGATNATSTFENPLFRSGLLFSGVNQSKQKGKIDNGVLTAFEISKLDLSKVDLVVLSACETGLGDVKGGEGVYGLQRAFKLAGANSIIISLWKVSDSTTSELMQAFYSFYLSGSSCSKQQALKLAQNKIRKTDPNPFNWAAFVIVE